ncbi:MAG: type II toxin-antitoxin system PemK/MazF family toxin, partial [Dehalococcoidia bacterium]
MYWVDFDPARGGETTKRRPAVIVRNYPAVRAHNRLQVIPR